MTVVELPYLEPGTPEWYEQRRNSLGGSEIGAVLGVSKYDSPFSLWHRKAGNIDPPPQNDEMLWGTLLEPVILQRWCDLRGVQSSRVKTSWRNLERPWQIAAPDLIVPGGVIVEAKTARYDDDWGEPGSDQIPPSYLAQCRWYLDCLGVDECHVVVLIAGSDYREYLVRPDRADTLLMQIMARKFIDSLPGGIAPRRPDVDAHDETYRTIKVLHPQIDPETVELDGPLARAFCTAKHALKQAETAAALQTSLLADAMGNAQRATFLDQRIARRQATKGGTPYVVAERSLPAFNEKETA